MKRMISWGAALGVATMVVGIVGANPAKADDDDYARRDNHHIYREIKAIRRDEARLNDLRRERREQEHARNWDSVHHLDRKIADLRWHIDHDRREIRRDADRDHNNH